MSIKRDFSEEQKLIEEIGSDFTVSDVKGHTVVAVEILPEDARLTSDVCSYLYRQNKKVPFVVTYSWNETEEHWNISFRSDKNGSNFDVGSLAKEFGGGGHRNVSRCTVKNLSDIFESRF